MAGRESPASGGCEAEPALRLSVRKDLFPEVRLPRLDANDSELQDQLDGDVSCVKLETDFEKSIDEIANQKLLCNGALSPSERPRHRKHKQHSRHNSHSRSLSDRSPPNGLIQKKKKKRSRHRHSPSNNMVKLHVKGGKNLNLVSSSECRAEEQDKEEEESSEDEVLKSRVPSINVLRQGGKPYSHELSQLSTKKSKSKDSVKERRSHVVLPCSGKPRSMLDISSRSKKKSKKSDCTPTYHSQIVDTNTIKIKIRRNSVHETITPMPMPTSIADIGQRKSKKKRAASPSASESSGEEYVPGQGETAAIMGVAAPKPRHPPTKTRKSNSKSKTEKTDRTRVSGANSGKGSGPQSSWASAMPEEILTKIFQDIVAAQGTLPSIVRLGKVCKLWHNVSCRPELWKQVDLSQHTSEKCKTDYKLVWLLENRLTHCQTLNIAQWKVCNVSWVLACLVEYCPELVELSVAGWSRLTPEQLYDLAQGLPKLQRLDLSLTSETGGSSTCLSASSMARFVGNFGERFTHLTLANNKFTALPQILSSIAAHCPNLEVLDISGARATTHPAAVPLEALQKGCPKIRVFRAANSQLVLASATTSQQMEAGGWTLLEELSIAAETATERAGVGEYRLGDEALARLVRCATRLRLLDLRGLQRLSDSGLVRVPAWDLQHLFLGGCNVTRKSSSCLELICEKWSHSLLELDLSWASAGRVLDTAVCALADATHSRLRVLNLCGSSVSLDPVKKVLMRCPQLESLNLAACRALPRGMKRLYTGLELQQLKESLDPANTKAKEQSDDDAPHKKHTKKSYSESKSDSNTDKSPVREEPETSSAKPEAKSPDKSSSTIFQEPKSVSEHVSNTDKKLSEGITKCSPDSKAESSMSKNLSESHADPPEGKRSSRDTTPKLLSPVVQSKPDSSSNPRSDKGKTDLGSPHFSPVPKPDSQVQNSPEVQAESFKGTWNLGQFKTTPTHRSEASPLNRLDSHNRVKASKVIEQCSPTTSLENKLSPEVVGANKQDIKNPHSWNYGNYSPMTRQDSQFSSQKSPYSAQPSPAQPSPYSAQPSPYSTQPSPYSSQQSPYSAQPSPDTSQIVKSDLPKSGAWNTGNYSPMPKHHAPFSPHPSTHTSPDPGLGVKSDTLRTNPSKTPGQYSPMSRQDRLHQSPYSPRPSVENPNYNNKKSPGVGSYSPMMRPDCHLPSPDGGQGSRLAVGGRQDMYGRHVSKLPDVMQSALPAPDLSSQWGLDRFSQMSNASIESLVWGTGAGAFSAEPAPPARTAHAPHAAHAPPPHAHHNVTAMLSTPPSQTWPGLPAFDSSVRRPNNDMSDPWTLGQFRVEPPHQVHNTFVEQNVTFESLSPHIGSHQHQHQSQLGLPQSYLDDGYAGSRLD